jgi:hypothetical protein
LAAAQVETIGDAYLCAANLAGDQVLACFVRKVPVA